MQPLLGSVIWKCVLRFGGTLVAGLLGLGALYFSVLCNDLSFEDKPAKVRQPAVLLRAVAVAMACCAAYAESLCPHAASAGCLSCAVVPVNRVPALPPHLPAQSLPSPSFYASARAPSSSSP